jgi:chromosome segregation protein
VFAEAFEAIDANFRVGFQTLFGGGAGEMRLTDRENIAESGIDIVCSPPGKRLQNVLLLSGGEKALAAVALLMAIFKYQPSPFCVMDEVDAPLDEANIGRLTRLLKEMSVDTQFVVITHSKRTMEAAETLYGVTMQEPGVSRMVSVKFNATTEAAA